jgi:hypothetical protein
MMIEVVVSLNRNLSQRRARIAIGRNCAADDGVVLLISFGSADAAAGPT